MKFHEFRKLERLLPCLREQKCHAEFVAIMYHLHQLIQEDLSAAAVLLYQEFHQRARTLCPQISLPDFYQGSDIEERFEKDPSNASIVLCLAMKCLYLGDESRAAHLLRRIESSGFRERKLAYQCLQRKFPGTLTI